MPNTRGSMNAVCVVTLQVWQVFRLHWQPQRPLCQVNKKTCRLVQVSIWSNNKSNSSQKLRSLKTEVNRVFLREQTEQRCRARFPTSKVPTQWCIRRVCRMLEPVELTQEWLQVVPSHQCIRLSHQPARSRIPKTCFRFILQAPNTWMEKKARLKLALSVSLWHLKWTMINWAHRALVHPSTQRDVLTFDLSKKTCYKAPVNLKIAVIHAVVRAHQ